MWYVIQTIASHEEAVKNKTSILINGYYCVYNKYMFRAYVHNFLMGSGTNFVSNKRDGFIFAIQRRDDLMSWGYPEEKLRSLVCGSAIGYLSVMHPCDDELYVEAMTIVESTKGIPENMSWNQKAGLIVWKINPVLLHLLCTVSGRRGRDLLSMQCMEKLIPNNE